MTTRTIIIAGAAAVALLTSQSAVLAEGSSFFGTFWGNLVEDIEVEGGTVKSGDYETVCDSDPESCGGDADLPEGDSGNGSGGDDASDQQRNQ